VANVCRSVTRRAPLTLLGEWPEPLHPVSAGGLPSPDDLDRADVVRAVVAGLPAGQRRAVALYYYADLPAGQIAEPPGAARASLHKARQRLREYIQQHRPDLVPAVSRRPPMTTVRITRVERRIRPGPMPVRVPTHVVVLADDAAGRELPIWLLASDGHQIERLTDRTAFGSGHANDDDDRAAPGPAGAGQGELARSSYELAARLLRLADAPVTGVAIDELGPEVTAARIELADPGGTSHVTARLAEGLAVALTTGAPLRVADTIMDRLAHPASSEPESGSADQTVPPEPEPVPAGQTAPPEPEPGPADQTASPIFESAGGPAPPAGQPQAADHPARPGRDAAPPPVSVSMPAGRYALAAAPGSPPPGRPRRFRPRYEPRNLSFADGLDHWLFAGNFIEHASESHWNDYTCTIDSGIAVISSAVAHPAGFAVLGQEVFADDYRGATITISGEFRADAPAGRAGLFLRVNEGHAVRGPLVVDDLLADPDNNATPVPPTRDWTRYEVTARAEDGLDAMVFGIFLAAPGRLEFRHAELTRVTTPPK
jgi:bifunctional DNase/RNase